MIQYLLNYTCRTIFIASRITQSEQQITRSLTSITAVWEVGRCELPMKQEHQNTLPEATRLDAPVHEVNSKLRLVPSSSK